MWLDESKRLLDTVCRDKSALCCLVTSDKSALCCLVTSDEAEVVGGW